MKSKKTLKIANWLMVLLTLGQVLIGSSASFAEEITSDSTSIVQKDTSSEEQKQVESTQGTSTVTKETESENPENFTIEDENSKSENANANDSPKQVNQMPVLKNEDIQTEIDNLLSENGLSIDESGKFHITNESSYRDNLFEVMQKIDSLRQQSKEQARAVLSYGLLLGRGNGVVVVPANENLSAVRFTRNNVTEYGWYGKKTADGREAYCIEPGVPLNTGNNPGYVISEANSDRAVKASLVDYYGHYKQPSLANKFYTESLINEVMNGYTTTIHSDINGQVSQAGYEAFKKDVMTKVNTFYTTPSFVSKTINLKVGESKTLTDNKGVLNYYQVIDNKANVGYKIENNKLILNAKNDSKENGTIRFRYLIDEKYQRPALVYDSPFLQNVFVGGTKDPKYFDLTIKVQKNGEFQIKKIDKETGKAVPGTKFKLEYSNLPAGTTAPKETEVTTDKNGVTPKIEAPHGTHVKATEIFVPAPYVLGSAIGDSDVVEGDVVANKTITLTQRNQQAKGQINIEKSGVYGKDMWNDNYSLEGNVFEIHENDAKGKVVATVTTDKNGHAETNKELPLGTYVVTEKTASNGFANTFKPVEVEIKYANQSTAVIVKNIEGTNQEVTGSTVLTKVDAETGSETQGQATFNGAQYGLFHEDGTPVKWSEAFKPEYVEGNKLEGDEIAFEMTDKLQKASVKHLALGKYYWKETKAPEGYQIDNTKREFEITYKDQDTKVIATESTSKENVVKFTLDGFKYVESKTGSTKSGYNGIEFKLTPINDTKGEAITTKTITNEDGYDGYFAFEGIPYGDYELTEVKAPEGYQIIKPLTITSDFDAEKREYTFTVTEKGQKEPLKVLTVSEEEINNGSNVIQLSKLFITNNLVKVPTIRTLATVDGEKTFTPAKDIPMHDDIFLGNLIKDDKYNLKIKLWRIQNGNYEKAQVVFETDKDFIAQAENEKEVIDTLVDTSKDDENTSYVWTEELFDKTGTKVAEHNDLSNKDQTVTPKIEKKETVKPVVSNKTNTPTSKPTQIAAKASIPQTSGELNGAMVFVVFAVVMVIAVGTFVHMKKRGSNK
ncbi:collagen binding domain-containing protein [Enterococcus sp. C76]|uniref:collagen binding domain-containing protein n=1 Tax=Enterococcus sp. C76 TaxID=3231334 RepID=UPI0034A048A6